MVSGVTEAYITVFKPATPGKDLDGSYIWNDQLLQYAAYGTGDSHIGDPKNVRKCNSL
jgi:nitric oxide synthase oxygenase domain/subunit